MMRKSVILQSYLYFAILTLFSCSGAEERTTPDVSHIELNHIQVERFDLDLQNLTPGHAPSLHELWKVKYGNFYQDYLERILKIASVENDITASLILGEISEMPDFKDLADSVHTRFPNLIKQEEELTDAFKRILYYLPESDLPSRFIAYFSGFAVQIPVGEDYIGIGLDLFMGPNFPYYSDLIGTYPRYISQRFTPENIAPRVVEAYIRQELLPTEPQETTLLNHMLHHGKAMYLMDLILPHHMDSLKIGYTDRQQAWAKHYQRSVWDWMIENKMLYQNEHTLLQQFFGESPFTPDLGVTNESAPKLGTFIGWQMVRQYMERFPNTSITQLLEMTDGQTFLLQSRYKGDYQIL